MLLLREMTKADLPLLLAWRNNPLIWSGTYTQRKPIEWNDHKAWWLSRNQDHYSFMVILFEDNCAREVGVLHISLLDYWSPEIGIIIGEVSLWNKGVGTEAFRLGCEWVKDKGYEWTSTTAPKVNKPMIKVLEKLGFEYIGEARSKWELKYRKKL